MAAPTDVDSDIVPQRLTLEFSTVLEDGYRRESEIEQRRAFVINCIIGCILYDSFLISDYFVSNDTYFYYVIGRIFVMTPISMLAITLILTQRKYYQILICVPFIAMAMTLAYLLTISHGEFRSSYLFGEILLMMCGCIIARPRLPYAIAMVTSQVIIYQMVVLTTDIVNGESKIVSILFCFSGAIVTIMMTYAMEQVSRRAFVLNVRVRLLNQRLESLAMTDALTGLANRRCFEEKTAQFWNAADAKAASMILIDIDRFKSFNDTFGHPAGDTCLSTVAKKIAGSLRGDNDLAVRFGGEEIIIFLPNTDFLAAHAIAETARLAIIDAGIPHPVDDPHAVVTASFGVATASIKDCTPLELVTQADVALYTAKRNGRNQVWPPHELIEVMAA